MNKYIKVIKSIIKSVLDNDFSGMAAEMGFFLIIGIFPFTLFLIEVFSKLGKKSFVNSIFTALEKVMPGDALGLIRSVISEVSFSDKGGLLAIIGVIITIILSTNAMAIILKGLNRAYKVEETRSFIYTRLLSLTMVFVNTAILFLTVNLIVFGKVILKFLTATFNLSPEIANTVLILRWPFAFLALFLLAYLQYYILPDLSGKELLRRKSALPGTIFFCISWLAGSWWFSIYVNNLHTYNFVYGTIGAFAVLMVWLYYTSTLILIGGEINSQLYNVLERKEIIYERKKIRQKEGANNND